jgi:hypothetical protein
MAESIFNFGKHEGKSFADVYARDRSYALWCARQNETNNPVFREFATFVREQEASNPRPTATDWEDPANSFRTERIKKSEMQSVHRARRLGEWDHEETDGDDVIVFFRTAAYIARCKEDARNKKLDNPSGIEASDWWLSAERPGVNASTRWGGKWLLYLTKGPELDHAWKKVRLATENGLLGPASKVATNKLNRNAVDHTIGVIVVYTENSNDERDCMRVANALRDIMDYPSKMCYKAHEASGSTPYAVSGDKCISKYYA